MPPKPKSTPPLSPFYACYLLRSTIRHSSLYIGSTPNPVRRLKQHNGIVKGGANKTSRDTSRPWEMTLLVEGFPSQVAALQFEWAWQNAHLTKHIPNTQRITSPAKKANSSHPRRPRLTPTSCLSNLHLLLRVPSFRRWPLRLRFLVADVHKAWGKVERSFEGDEEVNVHVVCAWPDVMEEVKQDQRTKIGLESEGQEGEGEGEQDPRMHIPKALKDLDVSYAPLKPHLVKAVDIMTFEREGSCAVCAETLEHDGGIYAVCTHEGCEAVSHIKCLGQRFIETETPQAQPRSQSSRTVRENEDILLPTHGSCPHCQKATRWVDVVRETSLRLRGPKEVEKLLKKPRAKKTTAKKGEKTAKAANSSSVNMIADNDDDDDDEDEGEEDRTEAEAETETEDDETDENMDVDSEEMDNVADDLLNDVIEQEKERQEGREIPPSQQSADSWLSLHDSDDGMDSIRPSTSRLVSTKGTTKGKERGTGEEIVVLD